MRILFTILIFISGCAAVDTATKGVHAMRCEIGTNAYSLCEDMGFNHPYNDYFYNLGEEPVPGIFYDRVAISVALATDSPFSEGMSKRDAVFLQKVEKARSRVDENSTFANLTLVAESSFSAESGVTKVAKESAILTSQYTVDKYIDRAFDQEVQRLWSADSTTQSDLFIRKLESLKPFLNTDRYNDMREKQTLLATRIEEAEKVKLAQKEKVREEKIYQESNNAQSSISFADVLIGAAALAIIGTITSSSNSPDDDKSQNSSAINDCPLARARLSECTSGILNDANLLYCGTSTIKSNRCGPFMWWDSSKNTCYSSYRDGARSICN